MNSGAEAVDTAIKLARKWAYAVKRVPSNEAIVLSFAGNFHGRTVAAVSLSTDAQSRDGFGPFVPRIGAICPATQCIVRFGSVEDLQKAVAAHHRHLAAVIVEPLQGEAG